MKICETCDVRLRLKMCDGKDGDVDTKYCFRRVGSVSNVPNSIKPFDEISELNIPDYIESETVEIEDYHGEHTGILIGVSKFDGFRYPIGFITK